MRAYAAIRWIDRAGMVATTAELARMEKKLVAERDMLEAFLSRKSPAVIALAYQHTEKALVSAKNRLEVVFLARRTAAEREINRMAVTRRRTLMLARGAR